jgi:hypothetical protein
MILFFSSTTHKQNIKRNRLRGNAPMLHPATPLLPDNFPSDSAGVRWHTNHGTNIDPIFERGSTSFNVALIKDHAPNIRAQSHGKVRRQAAPANGIKSNLTSSGAVPPVPPLTQDNNSATPIATWSTNGSGPLLNVGSAR